MEVQILPGIVCQRRRIFNWLGQYRSETEAIGGRILAKDLLQSFSCSSVPDCLKKVSGTLRQLFQRDSMLLGVNLEQSNLSKRIQRFFPGIVLEMSTDSEFQICVRHIDHVTLVVRDVEASRQFYVGLLGMTEVPRPAFSFGGAWFQAGATLIHLIAEHDRSGPAGYPVEVLVKSSRNHHFAFEVDDAYTAAAALKAKGIPLIDDAKLRPDGAVQVFLADPDHHVVELCSSPRR